MPRQKICQGALYITHLIDKHSIPNEESVFLAGRDFATKSFYVRSAHIDEQGCSYGGRRRAGPPSTHDFRPAQPKKKTISARHKKKKSAWHYVS